MDQPITPFQQQLLDLAVSTANQFLALAAVIGVLVAIPSVLLLGRQKPGAGGGMAH